MKLVFRLLSYVGLALSIVPPFLAFNGRITSGTSHSIMIVGMLLWFSTALLWIKPTKAEE